MSARPPTLDNPVPEPSSASIEDTTQPRPSEHPDAVDALISQAREHYKAGLAAFRSGDFEKAGVELDRAKVTLLESDLDLSSSQRLKDEFDNLVEHIQNLEVAALERGDVLGEQGHEPAAIESDADPTFSVDPRISQGVPDEPESVRPNLPLVSNEIVEGMIARFQDRGSANMELVLRRIDLYRPLFESELRKEGLPEDLIYLAGAESTFNPFALSRAGAKGLWQFMPSRAREYGLKKDRWVDEREDPVKSTQAAVRHLKDLYEMFGDWYLAMAAYNGGPGAVQRAVARTGYADFWMLRELRALPAETANYVPLVIATALIAKDPEVYGFKVEPDPPIETDEVVADAPTDLRLVAQLVDRPVDEIVRLNPGLLRWTTPANDSQYVLRLPKGKGANFEEAIAAYPRDKRVWWRSHVISDGDTLASVAKKYSLSTAALAGANHLEPDDVLTEGSRLVLPMKAGSEASLARPHGPGSGRLIRYKIRRGDTLGHIALRFDVTVRQLRMWNNLSSSRIIAGKTLFVYVPGGPSATSENSRGRPAAAPASTRRAKKQTSARKGPATAASAGGR